MKSARPTQIGPLDKASRLRSILKRPALVSALFGGCLALLVGLPAYFGLFDAWERPLYDRLLRLSPAPKSGRVVLVCRDEKTFQGLGNRIPTRSELASVLDTLWDRGAALVALDILLVSPSSPEDDEALESAMSRVDTIIASSPNQGLEPLERFRAQSVGVASIDLLTDPDGILRALPAPYLEPAEKGLKIRRLPISLAATLAVVHPKGDYEAVEDGGSFRFGSVRFPAAGGSWLIPFSGGDGTLPRISFLDALRNKDALKDLKGKVVLVGSTRASEHDFFAVPMPVALEISGKFEEISTHTMAGVEIQGQALGALLQGRSIIPLAPRQRGGALLAVFVAALLLMASPFRPIWAASIWGAGCAGLAWGSAAAMERGSVWPLFSLELLWCSHAAFALFYRWYRDHEGRRAVEKLFGRYVSPNIARRLLEHPELVQFGGRKKTLSILESDIRGFTTLSEQLPPERVSALLNEYFTEMTRILFEHDGTLDKFIGDAMLAFFGDPVDMEDHAERAVACAVAMQESAARLRKQFEGEGKPPLRIGIAVHTGPVVVGNHGSDANFDYTVIGDNVNLTARLQGLAQEDDVIVTVSTSLLVPGFRERYRFREMEPVRVKGKSEPIDILSVVSRA